MVVPSRRVHRLLPLMSALVACDPTLVAHCEEPVGMCDQPAAPVGAMTLRQVRERTPRGPNRPYRCTNNSCRLYNKPPASGFKPAVSARI